EYSGGRLSIVDRAYHFTDTADTDGGPDANDDSEAFANVRSVATPALSATVDSSTAVQGSTATFTITGSAMANFYGADGTLAGLPVTIDVTQSGDSLAGTAPTTATIDVGETSVDVPILTQSGNAGVGSITLTLGADPGADADTTTTTDARYSVGAASAVTVSVTEPAANVSGVPSLMLATGSDSNDPNDRITSDDTPTFNLGALVNEATVTVLAVSPDSTYHIRQEVISAGTSADTTFAASAGTCMTSSDSGATFAAATDCSFGTTTRDGDWTITATQHEPAKSVSAAATLMLTLDTVAPTVTLSSGVTSVAAGSLTTITLTISEVIPGLGTGAFLFSVSGTFPDLDGGFARPVQVSDTVFTATFTAVSRATAVTATLGHGVGEFMDTAGNLNVAGNEIQIAIEAAVMVSSTPAVALATASDSSSTSAVYGTLGTDSDGITNVNEPTITVTNVASEGTVVVTASHATAATVTAMGSVGTGEDDIDITLGTLADGDWTIVATHTDGSSNPATTADANSLSITIDTTAPTVSITTVPNTAPAMSKTFVAEDGDAGTTVMKSHLSADGMCPLTLTTGTADYTEGADYTLSDEANNGQYACFFATDAAGNIGARASAAAIAGIDTTAPTITLTTGDTNLAASGATATITATVSEASDLAMDDFSVSGGGTLSGFAAVGGVDNTYTITFTSGNTTTSEVTATISVAADAYADTAGNNDGTGASVDITVEAGAAPAPSATITTGDLSIDEGDTANVNAEFTVTLDMAPGTDITATVDYATADDTAVSGDDYQSASGTLTFANTEIAKTITVVVNPDGLYEADEQLTLSLSNPTGISLGAGTTATLTIADIDALSVSIHVSSVGGEAVPSLALEFTVTATGATLAVPLTLNYDTGGSATPGADFMVLPGNITIAAAQSTATISVLVIDDLVYEEPDENIVLTLTGASPMERVTLAAGMTSATVDIFDNEEDPATNSAQPTLMLAAAADTGVSDSDRVTNEVFPVFNLGNLVAEATVVVLARHPDAGVVIIRKTLVVAAGATTATVTYDNGMTTNCDQLLADMSIHKADTDECYFSDGASEEDDGVWRITAIQMEAGKSSATSDVLEVTLDTIAPTVTIDAPATLAVGAATTITVTVTANEMVSGFAAADITITPAGGGTLSGFAQVGVSNDYTVTFTAGSSISAVSITIPAGDSSNGFTDTAGNYNAATEAVIMLEEAPPPTGPASQQPTIALSTDTGINSSDRITKEEFPVFSLGNLLVNATVTVQAAHPDGLSITRKTLVASSGSATVTFANPGDDDSGMPASCDILAADRTVAERNSDECYFNDGSSEGDDGIWLITATQTNPGNANSPTDSDVLMVTLDTIEPTITLATRGVTATSANVIAATLAGGTTTAITLTTSEEVDGFTQDDVSAFGGTLSGFAQVGVNDYTITFTADFSSTAIAARVYVAPGSSGVVIVTDTAGNHNESSESLHITVEPTPILTIAAAASSVTEGDPATFIITANPAPSGSDLTVSVNADDGAGDFITGTAPNTVTITNGASTATLSVATTDDNTFESDGAITATVLQVGINYGLGAKTSATVVVNNNDGNDANPVVSFASGNTTVTEGDAVTLTITASPTPAGSNSVEVSLSETPRPFINRADLNQSRLIFNLTSGNADASKTLILLDDMVIDGGGTIVLTIAPDATRTGGTYIVGSPSSITLTVDDAGLPPSATPGIALADATNGGSNDDTITNVGAATFNLTGLVNGATVVVDALNPDIPTDARIRKTFTATGTTGSVTFGHNDGNPCDIYTRDGNTELVAGEMGCSFTSGVSTGANDGDWEIIATQQA
ncbi:MAG: beta strand repeat-containing protein, partial [Pseudohongiellaceae bacterium]